MNFHTGLIPAHMEPLLVSVATGRAAPPTISRILRGQNFLLLLMQPADRQLSLKSSKVVLFSSMNHLTDELWHCSEEEKGFLLLADISCLSSSTLSFSQRDSSLDESPGLSEKVTNPNNTPECD